MIMHIFDAYGEISEFEKNSTIINGRYEFQKNSEKLISKDIFKKLILKETDSVLDIGCGFGYSTAIISEMAELVIALEDEFFFNRAQKILSETAIDNTVIYEGKLSEGIDYNEKVDALIIQGGIEKIPSKIKDQVKDGGRVVAIFVDGYKGECRLGIKNNDEILWNYGFNAHAPLLNDFSIKKKFIF